MSDFESQQGSRIGESQGSQKQRPCFARVHTKPHMLQVPEQRQEFERSLVQIHLLILERLSGRQGAMGTLPGDIDSDSSILGNWFHHKDTGTGKCHFGVLTLAY